MLEDYRNALRAGQRAYRACVARGQSPYLKVLDEILNGVDIVAQEPLGLVDIPAESIVGTKTSGRHTAFAANFMPLLDDDTEFAAKWSNLCDAHLEEGIHTPIIAYEYLNRFYVQEGNKRVSVLKYYEAVTVPGTVTRLIPARNDTLENKIYYEFLDFYKLSKVNNVRFSKLGGYAKLQTLVCKASGEAWTDDDRLNFSSLYTMFSQQFYALGGSALDLTPGDALLVYLSVYRYSDACQSTPAQVRENLSKLWDEIRISGSLFCEVKRIFVGKLDVFTQLQDRSALSLVFVEAMSIGTCNERDAVFLRHFRQVAIVGNLLRVVMRLDFQIVVVLQQPLIHRMSNAHAIQRGSKAGTDLNDVTGNTKKLIKRDTGFVVKVVVLA